jgi:hypothetical protein
LHLLSNPPQLVSSLVQVYDRLTVAGQVVELATGGGVPDLAFDPALEAAAGGLSLGHRVLRRRVTER